MRLNTKQALKQVLHNRVAPSYLETKFFLKLIFYIYFLLFLFYQGKKVNIYFKLCIFNFYLVFNSGFEKEI